MSFSNIFSLSYWFEFSPGGWNQAGTYFLVGACVVLVLAIFMRILVARYHGQVVTARFLSKISSIFFFIGLTNLWYWAVRNQAIPLFSSRFWLLIIAIVAIWWLILTLKSIKKYKENREKYQEKQEKYTKYLRH